MKTLWIILLLAIGLQFASASPPTNGLVLYMPLDRILDGGGVLDLSGQGNHGGNSGAAFANGQGKIGSAYYFDGGNDIIQISRSASLDVNDEMTIAAWVNADDYANQNAIIYWWNFTNNAYGVHLMTGVSGWGTGANFVDDHVISHVIGYVNNPAAGQWHHLACTYSGTSGQAHFYVDGVQVKSSLLGSFIPETDFDLGIGSGPPGFGPPLRMKGYLDEVRIYNRALSSNEVYDVYAYTGEVNSVAADSVRQDYNNDGVSDFAVYSPSDGMWYIQNPVDNSVIAWALQHGYWGAECLSGDFDGDGFHDPAVYDPRDGRWYIRELDGTPLVWGAQWGFPNGEPVVGDFNGDGADDLGIYGIDTGQWYVRTLAGQVLYYGFAWGYPGVEPYAGKFITSKAEPSVYDDQLRRLYVFGIDHGLSHGANYHESFLRDSELVIGDFDGDGNQDSAAYHGNQYEGLFRWDVWHWDKSSNYVEQLPKTYSRGYAGAVPLAGNYDGANGDDLAVYGHGSWYVWTYSNQVVKWGHNWGGGNLVPVGRRMANPAVDRCEIRVVDELKFNEIEKVWLEDLERGTTRQIRGDKTVSMSTGWHRVTVKWRGIVAVYEPVPLFPDWSGEPEFLYYENARDIYSYEFHAEPGRFYKFKRVKNKIIWEMEEK